MLARALSFLLLSTAAMASSFHDKTAIDLVSTGDIAADSKLGSMVLSQARQLNNNDNNYDMTWVSGYSIKFQQCTATHDYYGGYFNGNNNNNNNNNNNVNIQHAASSNANNPNLEASTDEYPPSVQELVMNGFELSKVLHAYDLVGDNFDDLLSFLLSSAGAS
mmetsp:Transcript_2991/g.6474  ORF Transcript_2991/g.6474 Transcript_2991/m.6474 type:complete len:163 (+) Transcript_2991:101-589(+)